MFGYVGRNIFVVTEESVRFCKFFVVIGVRNKRLVILLEDINNLNFVNKISFLRMIILLILVDIILELYKSIKVCLKTECYLLFIGVGVEDESVKIFYWY